MAPSIPTHRPLVTATRVSVSIAIAACASSLYLAFGSAWATTSLPVQDHSAAAAICPVASSETGAVSAQAGAREPRPSIQ
jgi:hypothetical protein